MKEKINEILSNIQYAVDKLLTDKNLTSEQADILTEMLTFNVYNLVYEMYTLKTKRIPLFNSEDIAKIRIAYRDDSEPITSDRLALKITNVLLLLKNFSTEFSEVIFTLL